ncbi:MAG: hypothetical protein ABI310_06835 [Microbacteriaceae bacterium]
MVDVTANQRSRSVVHQRAMQLSVPEIVGHIQSVLGRELLALITGKDGRTVTRWISGPQRPPRAEEKLIRDTFQVLEVLLTVQDPSVVRAWFMGMNPQLDDQSPAEVLAEGGVRDVMAAARAFINAS